MYYLVYCIIYFIVGGPNTIITSAVAADLADHPTVKGNAKALGTVTGIINGSGSIIAAFGLLLIGPLQQTYGWDSVWMFLIVCVICGTLLMSPKVYKEIYHHESTDTTSTSSGNRTNTSGSGATEDSPMVQSTGTEMVHTNTGTGSSGSTSGGSYQKTLHSNEC